MSFLRMPRAIYDAIRAHGEETYPHECCGALLGRLIAADAARSEESGWVVEDSVPPATCAPTPPIIAIRLHPPSW